MYQKQRILLEIQICIKNAKMQKNFKIQKYVRNTKMYHKYKSVIEIHILYQKCRNMSEIQKHI